jgi:2-C-methyl-D-erythritol 4-phosphate cytidylyltransferase
MLEWSLDAFRAAESVRSIVVAVPPEVAGRSGRAEDVRQVGPPGDGTSIVLVAGGTTRAESVANALAVVETELVAIHDAARPLVTAELIEALVADLAVAPEAAGVIAATPITDTVKRAAEVDRRARPAFPSHSDGNAPRVIEQTLDRSRLWAAQTPQVFRAVALREALEVEERPEEATDESMLVEAAGGTVLIHPSSPENLKVTTPLDHGLAELLLARR